MLSVGTFVNNVQVSSRGHKGDLISHIDPTFKVNPLKLFLEIVTSPPRMLPYSFCACSIREKPLGLSTREKVSLGYF